MLPRRLLILAALASAAFTTVASAQAPAAAPAISRVRGTVTEVRRGNFTVSTKAGDKVTMEIARNTSFTWIQPISVSAIKPGAYIGTAAVSQPDGTLKAMEVQVFPKSMRGIGEGHRPWDFGPNSSMTNGTVGDVKVAHGRTLTLTYNGGEQKVYVPANAPVITYSPATKAALTKGAHIIAFVQTAADGTVSAVRVGVGKGKLVPPM